MARVDHEFARSVNFSASVKTIIRVAISESALSQRAISIGRKLIDEILPALLRPLAEVSRHPDAFHCGCRLAAKQREVVAQRASAEALRISFAKVLQKTAAL